MTNQSIRRQTIRLGMAGAALCTLMTGAAFAQSPIVTVTIFPDHYVYGDHLFDDLDQLEDAVAAAHPGGLRLEACGDGTARALEAAAHRFRNLYLDMRFSYIDDTICASASAARAVPAGQRFGLRPYGINDEAVDHWWRSLSFP